MASHKKHNFQKNMEFAIKNCKWNQKLRSQFKLARVIKFEDPVKLEETIKLEVEISSMSFVRTTDVSLTYGTYKLGELVVCYKDLEKLFGKPSDGSLDGKTSGEWWFTSEDDVVTIYDWKATCLYNGYGITVDEFRKLPLAEFSVGSDNSATVLKFKAWLEQQLPGKIRSFNLC